MSVESMVSAVPESNQRRLGRFDYAGFLADYCGDVDGVLGLLTEYYETGPTREAVRKWFTRSGVPAHWFPLILTVLERNSGAPVSVMAYVGGTSSQETVRKAQDGINDHDGIFA